MAALLAALPQHSDGLAILASLPEAAVGEICVGAADAILGVASEHAFLAEGALRDHEPARVKAATAGVASALLEAARADMAPRDVRNALEDSGVPAGRASLIEKVYEEKLPALRRLLGRTRFSLPQLVGVQWRLDYVVKTKHADHVNEPFFLLRFVTVQRDGQEEPLEVTCSEEQVSDLYATLKEASHQISLATKDSAP
mmetsp:Transcript_29415/g.67472  ORF Transcript_29415/g.67472 Transcript_29415/m.67472 type:complete len:199 (+) Transcript_29415:36-632(+)